MTLPDTPDQGAPPLLEQPYGYLRFIGVQMTAWSEGLARIELELRPELLNRFGIVHGGVHAMMLDTCMGFSGAWTGDPARKIMSMTLSMTTNFIGQARGTRLIADGRRTGGGVRTFFAEGSLRDDLGTLVATSTGVFRYKTGETA